MKYKIVAIHPDDAWYFTKELIGKTGVFESDKELGVISSAPKGFSSGDFTFDDSLKSTYFWGVRLEEVSE
jgi:hypothetical protein